MEEITWSNNNLNKGEAAARGTQKVATGTGDWVYLKKIIKYTSRIVLGALTIFFSFLTCLSLIPDGRPCGTMQANAIIICVTITLPLFVIFCITWHVTKKW